ncbi:DUF3426 domain-containing protein [Chitiniphilus eburneus]|uniref:DUF3426 domain-containing protein n=1 Tax=Chitiniphilus eburneus TaxID=2571148 RepID=A0A4U0QEV3_9NEIS|nr:DUF3426 domain-containing protein [Chitiniphilus eburneus]TJZ79202.1 DUF3426 domain-containing protein [Chitiniphilus eburneus]
MNHVTRCPNCRTAFKVSEDQLAAHGGKVRCGKCAFVFNARACIETPVLEETPPPAPVSPPKMEIVPPATAHRVPKPLAPAVAPAPAAPPEPPPPPVEAPNDTPVAAPAETSVADLVIAARKARQAARAVAQSASANAAQPAPEPMPEPEAVVTPEPEAEPEPIEETREVRPKSVAQKQADKRDQEALRAALKETPLTLNSVYRPIRTAEDEALLAPPPPPSRWRWLLLPLTLLLLLGLVGQVGLRYRSTLATDFPWLREPLVHACLYAGCEMPLPRNAELLRSDYSELTYVPDHGNLIQLAASVRNLAPYAQALPVLELTLTDDAEHVVAKKRFTPAQYLAADDKKRTDLAPNDELRAFLQLDVGELSSTGYSLYWFYP